jgi:hypothetical protein
MRVCALSTRNGCMHGLRCRRAASGIVYGNDSSRSMALYASFEPVGYSKQATWEYISRSSPFSVVPQEYVSSHCCFGNCDQLCRSYPHPACHADRTETSSVYRSRCTTTHESVENGLVGYRQYRHTKKLLSMKKKGNTQRHTDTNDQRDPWPARALLSTHIPKHSQQKQYQPRAHVSSRESRTASFCDRSHLKVCLGHTSLPKVAKPSCTSWIVNAR